MDIEGRQVRFDVTIEGNLSLHVGQPIQSRITPKMLDITREGDRVRMRCDLRTQNQRIERATTVVTGRRSWETIEWPADVRPDPDGARADWGKLHYQLSFDLRFDQVADWVSAEDDIIDIWVLVELEGAEKPIRVVPTLPKGAKEHRLRSSWTSSADRAVVYIPYPTYRTRRIAFRVEQFSAENYRYLRRLLRVSWLMPLVKPFTRIWLIGEVPFKAQDNGFHFFRYLRRVHPTLRAFYVLDADSADRSKVEPLGQLVERGSRRHILYSLLASRLVGSHHSEYLLASRDPAVSRRTRGVRIFLQHGVTAAKNVTRIYGRQGTVERPPEKFIVTSAVEQRIVVEDYGFSPHQVPITGFARFDALFARRDEPARTILVMPTWRETLHRETVLSSDFFLNWHGFLSDPELHRMLAEHNLDITLVLHPNIRMLEPFFAMPHVRFVSPGEFDVQDLLASSAVMITDYSSVAWDFSFLHRPVLYFHFDVTFSTGTAAPHIDFASELPGPIAGTPESLRRALTEVVDHGLVMEDDYVRRADRFFPQADERSCERIYQVVRDAWGPRTAVERVRNAPWVQRRWRSFRRSPGYGPWMRRLFRLGSRLPRRDTVVFEANRGAAFGDSPRYLYERLVAREGGPAPIWSMNGKTTMRLSDPRSRKILRNSPRYYWELSRARYWISNQNFANTLPRPKHTTFLQTWHGTPLKKMQHDVESMAGRDSTYQERAARLTGYWDMLLSASPYATRCFRSAFRFTRRVLEVGYPRNDVFRWPDAGERARHTRQRLGLADEKRTVILYAPTFRDDNRAGANWQHQIELDLRRLHRELGDDFVLLVRFHPLVRQSLRRATAGLGGFLLDVSTYPDVQELLLITDVLITDYSSLFFDFANLDRPMLFFAYDLEKYRDQLRGFYLEYEDAIPGPLLTDNDQVIEALRDLDSVRERYRDRLAAFVRAYAPADDGGASDRVLDVLLGSGSAEPAASTAESRAESPAGEPAPGDEARQDEARRTDRSAWEAGADDPPLGARGRPGRAVRFHPGSESDPSPPPGRRGVPPRGRERRGRGAGRAVPRRAPAPPRLEQEPAGARGPAAGPGQLRHGDLPTGPPRLPGADRAAPADDRGGEPETGAPAELLPAAVLLPRPRRSLSGDRAGHLR